MRAVYSEFSIQTIMLLELVSVFRLGDHSARDGEYESHLTFAELLHKQPPLAAPQASIRPSRHQPRARVSFLRSVLRQGQVNFFWDGEGHLWNAKPGLRLGLRLNSSTSIYEYAWLTGLVIVRPALAAGQHSTPKSQPQNYAG